MGINGSWDRCCYHDSYPYCPSTLRSLFALEVKVCTECATRQSQNLGRISLESSDLLVPPSQYIAQGHWLSMNGRFQLIPTNGYVLLSCHYRNDGPIAFIAFIFTYILVPYIIARCNTDNNDVVS